MHRRLTEDAGWLKGAENPHVRRIDSGNHPDERGHIIAQLLRKPRGCNPWACRAIYILISTDVLSEGQNLQDCGNIINYDLTWEFDPAGTAQWPH